MNFAVVGNATNVETRAVETSIRELPRLRRIYGGDRWKKCKGFAVVRLGDGRVRRAELHW